MFIDDFPPELWDKMTIIWRVKIFGFLKKRWKCHWMMMTIMSTKSITFNFGSVAESVDAPDLKSVEDNFGGSSPPTPIALMLSGRATLL